MIKPTTSNQKVPNDGSNLNRLSLYRLKLHFFGVDFIPLFFSISSYSYSNSCVDFQNYGLNYERGTIAIACPNNFK